MKWITPPIALTPRRLTVVISNGFKPAARNALLLFRMGGGGAQITVLRFTFFLN